MKFFIYKLYVFLFKKPRIKIGDKLKFYDSTCKGLLFDWDHGLWFIKIKDVTQDLTVDHISYEVELYYREKMKAV